MKPNLTYFNKRSLLDSDETSAELLSPKRMLDELYTIASIQGEIAAPGANVRNVLSSEVHTVAGVQRKRRNEVALAIDHQAFNVYDVGLQHRLFVYQTLMLTLIDPSLQACRILSCVSANEILLLSAHTRSQRPWAFSQEIYLLCCLNT